LVDVKIAAKRLLVALLCTVEAWRSLTALPIRVPGLGAPPKARPNVGITLGTRLNAFRKSSQALYIPVRLSMGLEKEKKQCRIKVVD